MLADARENGCHEHRSPHRRHRRRRPHPVGARQARGRAQRHPSGRPRRARAARRARAQRAGIDADRRRAAGLREPGRRADAEHRAAGRARRRLRRARAGDDDRPAVRLEPAGDALRGPGSDGGAVRHRHRGRRRVDESRAAGRRGVGRGVAVLAGAPRALSRGPREPGRGGGAHRAAMGTQPRRSRRVRCRVARAGGGGRRRVASNRSC